MAVSAAKARIVFTPVDTAIGLGLAGLILGAWLGVHIVSIFFVDWIGSGLWPLAPLVVALQCWLSVGMFIVAHDTIHGSLVPGRQGLNHAIGQLCVGLYAGFSYAKLSASHHDHHRYAGTEQDPDFDANHPSAFWPWYLKFFRTYFGVREFAALAVGVAIYAIILGPRWPNMLVFWALPAILSSLQLFYFGTYRPHRIEAGESFADAHRTRSNDFPWLVSLLTCFHFGYHHEHHDKPWTPWWKLPSVRERA